MKKRLLFLLLVLAMLFAAAPSVFAETYSGSCGMDLKWSLDTDSKVLRITGTGPMLDYGQNYEPWHVYNDQYTKVIVEEGCTHIGSWAFGFSENLQDVVLPNSLTSIGSSAFAYCSKLVNCPIPNQVTTIQERAFIDCRNMVGLTLPDTLTAIGKSAFGGCKSLTKVNIPGGVNSLPYGVFDGCTNLSTLTIAEGVEYLGESVFRGTGVVTVTLPYSLISTGLNTFRECDSLEVVTMLGCKEVGDSCFWGCGKLRKVTLAENTERLQMYAFAYCNALVSLRLPESVVEVKHGALNWHQSSGLPSLSQVVVLNPDCVISYYSGMGQPGVCTIYGYKNSTAHTYAVERGYNFDLIGNEDPEPSIFSDVNNNAFYSKPVEWAVSKNITTGMTPTTFVPDATCTRGQVVTFLWRSLGSPEPKTTTHNFTDVKEGTYYYKAMLWAVENGITNGMTPTTFEPNATCSRGQVVTFLWRTAGKIPATVNTHSFKDVDVNSYYYNAMLWAVENGITTGTAPDTFAPAGNCTRGQVVTFLHRNYK